MAWIKRNIGMLIGGIVALVLLGLGGWYLYSKMQEDEAITAELDQATSSFKEIVNRPIHPGNDRVNNIQLAKDEHKKMEDVLMRIRNRITGPELPKDLTNKDFRALLDNTVAELAREADRQAITLPQGGKDYWFTFAVEKTAVEFKSLETLTYALMDIKSICDVLYSAKIHDLIALKRVSTSSDESGGDFLYDKRINTNDYTIVSPYEVTFQGFSSELARVMEGLIKAKRCFVVKNIGVDVAPNAGAPPKPKTTTAPPPMMFPGRYGPMGGGRYGGMAGGYGMGGYGMGGYGMPQVPIQPQSVPQAGPRKNVLLDENKLRFTLSIDSVRLKPLPAKKPATAQPAPKQLTSVTGEAPK